MVPSVAIVAVSPSATVSPCAGASADHATMGGEASCGCFPVIHVRGTRPNPDPSLPSVREPRWGDRAGGSYISND